MGTKLVISFPVSHNCVIELFCGYKLFVEDHVLDGGQRVGINPKNGKGCPIKTGYLYEMNSMDELKAAIEDVARWVLKWHVTMNNYTEYLMMRRTSLAALSMSIEGCMENGKDATQGGAKYNSYGGVATGLATIADSLTTIKSMIEAARRVEHRCGTHKIAPLSRRCSICQRFTVAASIRSSPSLISLRDVVGCTVEACLVYLRAHTVALAAKPVIQIAYPGHLIIGIRVIVSVVRNFS